MAWTVYCDDSTAQMYCVAKRDANNQQPGEKAILEYLKTENILFKDANHSETAFRICILDTLGTL